MRCAAANKAWLGALLARGAQKILVENTALLASLILPASAAAEIHVAHVTLATPEIHASLEKATCFRKRCALQTASTGILPLTAQAMQGVSTGKVLVLTKFITGSVLATGAMCTAGHATSWEGLCYVVSAAHDPTASLAPTGPRIYTKRLMPVFVLSAFLVGRLFKEAD